VTGEADLLLLLTSVAATGGEVNEKVVVARFLVVQVCVHVVRFDFQKYGMGFDRSRR